MAEESIELNDTLKKLCSGYLYSIAIIFTIFTFYYYYEGVKPLDLISGIYLLVHIILLIIPRIFNYNIIKFLVPLYLFILSVALIPIVCFFWQFLQITAIIWYLLIPLASFVFFSNRITLYWSIYIIITVCLIFFMGPVFAEKYVFQISNSKMLIINIMTIASYLYLLFFFLYYLGKINKIKAYQESYLISAIQEKEEVSNNRYNEVYKNILRYFDKNKPYCHPEFTVSQLAVAINSNVSYISKAIKVNKDMNFNHFINTYRVSMVKMMLDKGYHNKYTMMYIYESSGFKHQSTFNKVFKQIEGITPSEYVKNLEQKHTNSSKN